MPAAVRKGTGGSGLFWVDPNRSVCRSQAEPYGSVSHSPAIPPLVVFTSAPDPATLQFPRPAEVASGQSNRIDKEEDIMNSVHLIGRLATDVDVKEVNGGSKVSTFILAVDRNAEEADFFRIKAWNSQAEAAGDHLGKGRRIAVEGSLRQDVYEKDGEERKAVSVVAKRLEYL
jgi:single-strand DNA-binding protein